MNDRLLKKLILKEINSVLKEQQENRQEKAIRDLEDALMGLGMLVGHMDARQDKMYDKLTELARDFIDTFDFESDGEEEEYQSPGRYVARPDEDEF